MKKRGFSLLEVIIAMAFLSVAILSMFWMNRASNQGSMDAYYEFLAFSLAREPIEVFRGFGYDYLKMIADGNVSPPSWYPVGAMKDIEFDLMSDMQYPAEARLFQRLIELTPVTAGKLKRVPRTDNNPHGLLVVNWRTLLNKDIEQKTKVNY